MINILRNNFIIGTGRFQKTVDKTTHLERGEFDIYIFWAAVFVLASFIVSYIMAANSIAGAGYKIKNNEKIIVNLKSENSVLRQETAKVASPKNLNELAKGLNLVESKNVTYIKIDNTVVGLNKKLDIKN